jgi:hypothetical protein
MGGYMRLILEDEDPGLLFPDGENNCGETHQNIVFHWAILAALSDLINCPEVLLSFPERNSSLQRPFLSPGKESHPKFFWDKNPILNKDWGLFDGSGNLSIVHCV